MVQGQSTSTNAINNVSACSVLSTDRVVFSTWKNFGARDAVECSNVFLSAGNNLECSKTLLNTLRHCLLRLDNSHK